MTFNDDFDELPSDELFPDENELKKEITKLNRKLKQFREEHEKDIKKLIKQHDRALENADIVHKNQIDYLFEQNRELLEKNMELKEISNIFVKGLGHLKKDGIKKIEPISWKRKGVHGSLEKRIKDLAIDGKTIISVVSTHTDSHGFTDEALIIVEHYIKEQHEKENFIRR